MPFCCSQHINSTGTQYDTTTEPMVAGKFVAMLETKRPYQPTKSPGTVDSSASASIDVLPIRQIGAGDFGRYVGRLRLRSL